MPGYVFTLFALGARRASGAAARRVGAVAIFTLVLYPYVYLLAPRGLPRPRSRTLLEAARGLGLSRARAIVRVALPLARPAIFGGVALALMEALADFGTVNLLGVQTFTDAIYRVWFGAFDRDAAMQLGDAARVGHAHAAGARAPRPRPRALRPATRHAAARAAGAAARRRRPRPPSLGPLAAASALVVAAPLVAARLWAVAVDLRTACCAPEFGTAARNSLLLAGDERDRSSRAPRSSSPTACAPRARGSPGGAARVATIGYGLPGLGGRGGRDRAAGLARPPPRRRRRRSGCSSPAP